MDHSAASTFHPPHFWDISHELHLNFPHTIYFVYQKNVHTLEGNP